MTAVTAITGASRGLGRACAIRLAHDGHAVAVGYHRDERAAEAVVAEVEALGVRAVPVRVDVTVRIRSTRSSRPRRPSSDRSPGPWPMPARCAPSVR